MEERVNEIRRVWRGTGYIAKSKTGNTVVIMIGRPDGTKEYYIADLNEALEVLTGKRAYTRVLKRAK